MTRSRHGWASTLTKDLNSQALRTALDPEGSWIPAVLAAADRRLSEVRRHVPDAGGLVIATDQDSARAYAALLAKIAGEKPIVVLSDEKAASKRIAEFGENDKRWMVAVRMVSEGVDVPRLAVGVYATTTGTPLFFAQAVGRFVRARARGEIASIFLPSAPALLGFAAELEAQRDHVLGRVITDEDDIFAAERDLLAAAAAGEAASDELAVPGYRGARVGGAVRPRAVRRRDVRSRRGGARRARRRRWTSSGSPACSSPTRSVSCCTTGRRSGPAGGRRRSPTPPFETGAARPPQEPSRRSRPTSSSRCCVAS